MIAALFVRENSHYKLLPGVDAYDHVRDALTWQGGCPGVFHPPCRGWGRLKGQAKPRPGELELALWSMAMVRRFGGVVEHPDVSSLWKVSRCASWGIRDQYGGVLFPVLQSWFGHRAPKRTCLYLVGALVPELPSDIEPSAGRIANMGKAERERTPEQFASWLVDLARSCEVPQ